VNIRCEDSVEAITNAYKSAWMAFCDEETRSRQQAEEVIRQVGALCLYFSRSIVDYLYQAEERGRAAERARFKAERHELEAYRRMGPLKG
jgi:hypothetical protein